MEWENNWESWKAGRFYDLQTNEMENLANAQFRKFTKWARDLKVSCMYDVELIPGIFQYIITIFSIHDCTDFVIYNLYSHRVPRC